MGAAVAVAGGTMAPGAGAEILLRLPIFQWLGKLSYSLYLWHWPALIIPKQALGRDLLPAETVLVLLLAVGLSALTYRLIEHPVRNSAWLKSNSASISVALGVVFVGVSFLAATGVAGLAPHAQPPQPAPNVVFPTQ
jgi:peptidoglycan/LPS O-acetylase OafA/YrhL